MCRLRPLPLILAFSHTSLERDHRFPPANGASYNLLVQLDSFILRNDRATEHIDTV